LAAGERSPVSDRCVANRFHIPFSLPCVLPFSQRAEEVREIFVTVTDIPTLITRPQARHVDARVFLAKLVRRKIPQIVDRVRGKYHGRRRSDTRAEKQRKQGEETKSFHKLQAKADSYRHRPEGIVRPFS